MSGEVFARDEWARHGRIVPACIVGIMLVAVHNYALGSMYKPLEQEFGWHRAEIAWAAALPSMAAVIMAPLVGVLLDRVGVRRLALVGVPAFCGCLASLSLAGPGIGSWIALYFLLGVASMLIFPTIWTAAINARFNRNRGKALAITLSGTGITATLVPWLTTHFVATRGWRGAYVELAAILFVIVYPPVVLLFARDEKRLREEARVLPGHSAPDRPLLAELLAPRFLKLAGAAMVFGLAVSALTGNAKPILNSEGFGDETAAAIAGLVGIGSIAGRLLGGVLLDHFEARKVAAWSMVLPITGVAMLLLGQGDRLGAGLACVLIGLSAGTEYDACAYLAARHFGMKRFGALFGTIGGVLLLANGIAPVLIHEVYDRTGNYNLALIAILPLLALAAGLFLALGPYPDEPAGESGLAN